MGRPVCGGRVLDAIYVDRGRGSGSFSSTPWRAKAVVIAIHLLFVIDTAVVNGHNELWTGVAAPHNDKLGAVYSLYCSGIQHRSAIRGVTTSGQGNLKLAIVVPSLGAGGAERVAGIVANGLARSGVQVTFIALDRPDEPRHVDLENEVHLMRLALTGASRNSLTAISTNWTRIRALRRALQTASPDGVLSAVTETNVLTLMAAGRRWPVLVWEHTDPWLWKLKKPWWWARWFLYRRAVSVVFLSRHHANYFKHRGYQIMSEVIPNPVPALSVTGMSEGAIPVPKPFILGVGRLDRLKGFFELLGLFKQVKSNHPEWSLVIVGDGNEAASLKQSAEYLGIAQSVYFTGAVMDPYPYYRAGEIFISLSELEGFPMALIEAMSCGCPVVVNAYSEAVQEIIDHGQNGFIVDRSNKENLYQVVNRLVVDDKLRKQIGHNGASVLDTYAEAKIIDGWKQLIAAVL